MSDYTPTTEEVADAYANGVWNDGVGDSGLQVAAGFERWLAKNDAEVAAAALEDTADWLMNCEWVSTIRYEGASTRDEVVNAYDAALEDPESWLREHAAEYRKTETEGE